MMGPIGGGGQSVLLRTPLGTADPIQQSRRDRFKIPMIRPDAHGGDAVRCRWAEIAVEDVAEEGNDFDSHIIRGGPLQ